MVAVRVLLDAQVTVEDVEPLSSLLFLAQETMVKLKRDIRIMCKIFFILYFKSQEFIANLKSHIFKILESETLSRKSKVTESAQETVNSTTYIF